MPQGLQVFDGSANLQVDVTTRLTRMLGSVITYGSAGSFTIPEAGTGDPWIYPTYISGSSYVQQVELAGDVISWAANASTNLEIYYGRF